MDKRPEVINYGDTDFSDPQILTDLPYRFRRCPVIVTLADVQISEVDIQKMLETGMNVAKFKLSSSSKGDKIRLLSKIKKAVRACCDKYAVRDWPIATCIELKTCIVKTGSLDNAQKSITIVKNSNVVLTFNITYLNKCSANTIFIDNKFLVIDAIPGTEISIASDEIIVKCIEAIDDKSIKCIVMKGGMLTNHSNVCTRHVKHSRPLLSRNDMETVKFALEYQMDAIIINYVRHPDTLRKIKSFIRPLKVKRPFLMCGICTEEGLQNIDEIVKETDGLILSREYLPYEMEASSQGRMPQIQKWMAGKCLQAGKPFYISGGVFEKALESGNFIDCEISDVTTALLDGASGLILKDCYDADLISEVLKGINNLCFTIEPLTISKTNFRNIVNKIPVPVNAAHATVISCVGAANVTNARVVIVPTVSGKTIKYLHCLRPCSIVIAVTTDLRVMQLLHIYRSIMPLMYYAEQRSNSKWNENISARVFFAVEYAVNRSWLEYGDTYVTLQRGSESSSFCDTVKIWKVSIMKKLRVECPDGDELKSQSVLYY